ncbi:MAG: maleylpyruvate isomerase N-terminal domain-containing protein [Candidatus Dormibacteria bacterium]|jgi:hypothetical protein
MHETRLAYLAAAGAAGTVVKLEEVGARWAEPSALAEMTIGDLTAHLVRAVTSVPDCLAEHVREKEEPLSAAAYFLPVTADLSSSINTRVRHSSSDAARAGHAAVVADLEHAQDILRVRLSAEPEDRLVEVKARGEVLLLDEYLKTRIIELVVHIDDLCVSLGRPTPTLPGVEVAISTLIDVAALRHGELSVLRALARRERDPDEVLRVI